MTASQITHGLPGLYFNMDCSDKVLYLYMTDATFDFGSHT